MARAYDEEDHPLSERSIEQQNEGRHWCEWSKANCARSACTPSTEPRPTTVTTGAKGHRGTLAAGDRRNRSPVRRTRARETMASAKERETNAVRPTEPRSAMVNAGRVHGIVQCGPGSWSRQCPVDRSGPKPKTPPSSVPRSRTWHARHPQRKLARWTDRVFTEIQPARPKVLG